MICGKCGFQNSKGAAFCGGCGAKLETAGSGGKKSNVPVLIGVGLALAAGLIVGILLSGGKDTNAAKQVSAANAAQQTASAVHAGDMVTFGSYEQDNNTENGKEAIQWQVLEVQGDRALVISRYTLIRDMFIYGETMELEWDECFARSLLNDTFLKDAFTAAEQRSIIPVDVHTVSAAYGREETVVQDGLFLLSEEEVIKYFPSEAARVCYPTLSARGRCYQSEYWVCASDCADEWFVRDASNMGCPKVVERDGAVSDTGCTAICGFRPAMWVKTEALQTSLPVKIDYQAGDIVTFGSYEQDNNTENGKEAIEWQVLHVWNNQALLLAQYGLDAKPYNTEYEDVTWETCSLRSWLNSDFLNTAFTAEEQRTILNTWVSNGALEDDTRDKVFLLSEKEARGYLGANYTGGNRNSVVSPTAYAKAQGAYFLNTEGDETVCFWWLRSCSHIDCSAMLVDGAGSVYIDGFFVSNDTVCVRPALWVNLESDIF